MVSLLARLHLVLIPWPFPLTPLAALFHCRSLRKACYPYPSSPERPKPAVHKSSWVGDFGPDRPRQDVVEVAPKPKTGTARLNACASADVIPLPSSAHSSPVPLCEPTPFTVTVHVTSTLPLTIGSPFFSHVMLFMVSIRYSRVHPRGEKSAFSRSV